jgi:protoheme IX farnesyltransferase
MSRGHGELAAADTETSGEAIAPRAPAAPRGAASCLGDYLQLTKPRVTTLVVTTTAVGFVVGSRGRLDLALLMSTIVGTLLVAAGTSAFNQYIEREEDGRMLRTRSRPLPAGRLAPLPAFLFALAASTAGLLHLLIAVNPLTALVAALTLSIYLFAYTPLKRISSLCTLVGAIPGALPALMGWTASQGEIGAGGLALFAILFVWQVPHSLAIAWMYREDYARGGFALLPVVDPEGGSTGRQIVTHSLVLLPVSLVPTVLGIAGPLYFYGTLLLGLALIAVALPIALDRTTRAARRMLLASVIYLPILLGLMALDRIAPPLR